MKILIIFIFTYTAQANQLNNAIEDINNLNNVVINSKNSCSDSQEKPEFKLPLIFKDMTKDHALLYTDCKANIKPMKLNNYAYHINWKICKEKLGENTANCRLNVWKDSKKKIYNEDYLDRVNSEELFARMKSFIIKKFPKLVQQTKSICCSDNTKHCTDRFDSLQIEISNSSDSFAQYSFDGYFHNYKENIIKVSKGNLAKYMTEQGIERMLYHELGHVCHLTKIKKENINDFTSRETRCSKENGKKNFYHPDPKIKACIIKNIDKQISQHQSSSNKYCFGKWYREAVADTIFMELQNIYHWQELAGSYQENAKPIKNYAVRFKYVNECLRDYYPLNQLCGNDN